MNGLGRTLIMVGGAILILGIVLALGDRLPVRFGKLPGDLVWREKNSVFYFPVVTCLLLSIIVSLAMWLVNRMR